MNRESLDALDALQVNKAIQRDSGSASGEAEDFGPLVTSK